MDLITHYGHVEVVLMCIKQLENFQNLEKDGLCLIIISQALTTYWMSS